MYIYGGLNFLWIFEQIRIKNINFLVYIFFNYMSCKLCENIINSL